MTIPLAKRTTTIIDASGQVTIPEDVRDAIGLVPGRTVDVGINDRGEAVVVPSRGSIEDVSRRRPDETPEEREARIDALFAAIRARPMFTRPTEEIMRELRGDEPLP